MPDKKTKILLVEDDAMIVEMYKMRLEAEGYEVFVTDRGTEALDIAGREKPALVLLDIILPEVDGFNILDNLKSEAKTKDIPVMLLTNLGQESDQERGQKAGAADYFVKSQHTPAEVMQKVKELIK